MKVSSGRRIGCGSRSNAGLLKKDMFRIENMRAGSREKGNFMTVNVLPVLLKLALVLNANFSIKPFHANF